MIDSQNIPEKLSHFRILDKCTLGTFGYLGYILLQLVVFESSDGLQDSDNAQLWIALVIKTYW